MHGAGNGETRARIKTGRGTAVELRSGATVPIVLPTGFTLYPGAEVVRTTTVERGGARRMLIEFRTSHPVAKVLLFHRAQAQAAGAVLEFDLDGSDAASIGGRLAGGGDFALTARADGKVTRVEMAVGVPNQAQ